jgi:hypothetical protein
LIDLPGAQAGALLTMLPAINEVGLLSTAEAGALARKLIGRIGCLIGKVPRAFECCPPHRIKTAEGLS